MRYAKDFKQLFNDPTITRYTSIPYPLTGTWIRDYITTSMEKYDSKEKLTWGIFKTDIKKFVGVGVIKDIDYKNKVGKLGYSVGKHYWNRGYTLMAVRLILKYAFEELDLNRIEVRIAPDDEKSIKLLEILGGEKEGEMRKAFCYNNSFSDVYLYSILKKEYLERLKVFIENHPYIC